MKMKLVDACLSLCLTRLIFSSIFESAHAPSRVTFGALAKGIFAADRVGSAKKFVSAREGACAPRIPAPERPVFPAGSLIACEEPVLSLSKESHEAIATFVSVGT